MHCLITQLWSCQQFFTISIERITRHTSLVFCLKYPHIFEIILLTGFYFLVQLVYWNDLKLKFKNLHHEKSWLTNPPPSTFLLFLLQEKNPVSIRLSSLTGHAAAAAKSLQSCPTLCDPIDISPPGSPAPGILQARKLEWVAISFSNAWKWKVKGKSLSRVQLLAAPWAAAH